MKAKRNPVIICYHELRRVFWLRHYLNRLIPSLKARGTFPVWPRLCAFPNDLIGREISVAGMYEMAGISSVARLCACGAISSPESSVFVDVGANVGVYSMSLSKYFGTVLAFEPHPVTSKLLNLNVEINGARNVTTYQCALSDHEGKAVLTDVGTDNMGASTLEGDRISDLRLSGKTHEVNICRGDEFLTDGRLGARISFIKIDVEGHEEAVIAGMSELIYGQMPVIAFEANSGARSERVRTRLADLGYTTFLGLCFYPRIRSLSLRVLILTIFGVRHALEPVGSLGDEKYSLVFAMTDAQKSCLDKMSKSAGGASPSGVV